MLRADELPAVEAPNEAPLTDEPRYEGEPILAVAAIDEETAAERVPHGVPRSPVNVLKRRCFSG